MFSFKCIETKSGNRELYAYLLANKFCVIVKKAASTFVASTADVSIKGIDSFSERA